MSCIENKEHQWLPMSSLIVPDKKADTKRVLVRAWCPDCKEVRHMEDKKEEV